MRAILSSNVQTRALETVIYRQGAEEVFMNKKHNLDELKVFPKVRFI